VAVSLGSRINSVQRWNEVKQRSDLAEVRQDRNADHQRRAQHALGFPQVLMTGTQSYLMPRDPLGLQEKRRDFGWPCRGTSSNLHPLGATHTGSNIICRCGVRTCSEAASLRHTSLTHPPITGQQRKLRGMQAHIWCDYRRNSIFLGGKLHQG